MKNVNDPKQLPNRSTGRDAAGQAMRLRLLNAAVSSLIELGVARTTTLEVQRRAACSRGALLHHFASHADLLSASVAELVRRNELGAGDRRVALKGVSDPLERAIKTLAAIVFQPSYMAEMELWALARTDAALHAALVGAERRVLAASDRVVSELFHELRDRPGHAVVVALSLELLRGLALSSVLSKSAARRSRLIDDWVRAARLLLDQGS